MSVCGSPHLLLASYTFQGYLRTPDIALKATFVLSSERIPLRVKFVLVCKVRQHLTPQHGHLALLSEELERNTVVL